MRFVSFSRPCLLFLLVVLASCQCLADDGPKAVGDNFFINTEWVNGSVGGKSSVASDGTDYLVVWRDRRAYSTNGYDIYCARITRNGVVLDPHGIGISVGPTYDPSPSNQYIPSVTFDGTNYYVFWVENKVSGDVQYQVYGARVTTSGTVLDPGGVPITSSPADPQRMPAVGFDGTNFMIVWRTTGNVIRAMRVSKALQSLDGPAGFSITSPAYYPSIAFDGTNFLITYHFGNPSPWGTGAAIIGQDGTIIKQAFTVSQETMSHEHTSVASSGTNYLIAWYDWKPNNSGNKGSIYAARVDLNGNVLDASPLKVADDGRGQTWPEVAFDGRDYFVVWQQEAAPNHRNVDIQGRRISTDGILGERIGIATGDATQFAPGLAYATGRFLVVWQGQCGNEGVGFCGPDGSALEGQFVDKGEGSLTAPALVSPEQESSSWSLSAGPFPMAAQMNGVWAASDSDVHTGGDLSVQHFNGSAWSEMTGPWGSRKDMFALWGSSPTDIWATGSSSVMFHFNGSAWSFQDNLSCCLNTSYLGYGLWGLSPTNLWLVGSRGSARQWNGTSWTSRFLPTPTTTWSVWASAANDVYAVGDHGRIFHYDGSAWTAAANVPTSVTLNHIWGSRAGNIFAVGDFGTILRFNGSSWEPQPTGLSAHLYGVYGTSGSNVFAVGQYGTILHYDGVKWRTQTSGRNEDLTSLWSAGPGKLMFAAGGVVLQTPTIALATASASKSTLNVGAGFPGSTLQGTVTLSVSGQTALQITQISASGGFQQTNDCGVSVAVGASCTITVQLTPQSFLQYGGNLAIISNAANSPIDVPLSGAGIDIVLSLSRPQRTPRAGTPSAAQTTAFLAVKGPPIQLQLECDLPGTTLSCSVDPPLIRADAVPRPINIRVRQATRASRLRQKLPSSALLRVQTLEGERRFESVFQVPLTN